MEFTGVYHKTSEQMSYPLDEDRLIVNIKTGYDVKQVFIHYGDPYEAGILGGNDKWTGKREEIIYKKRLPHQIWWTTTLFPAYKRCKYYFELRTEKEVWYYFEDGFLTEEQLQMEGRMQQCFIVPWMNPADINRTPAWVNDTIWYQIFPDRFCNGTPEKNGNDITPWRNHGTVTNKEKFGGNLEGIRQRLPYLQELGITGIYLNPIMEAESNHKYDTTDYTKIDPAFGDEETMKALCREAHEKGIRIMVDAVFNHCGRKFAPWVDVLEHGKDSCYADWFMIEDWEQIGKRADTRDRRFYSFAFTDAMPKLNTNNEEVIEYFCKVCEEWIRKFDIDGIRFDVGNEVSHRFLKRIREHLKAVKPDLYLLGEIWHDAMPWLGGDEFDAVMNYPFAAAIREFWYQPEKTKSDLEEAIHENLVRYMRQTTEVLFNLMDSHDTDRLIHQTGGNQDLFFQQLAMLFTMPGSPCIYYGTEIAIEGGADPDCRRCMPWDQIEQGNYAEITEQVKQLIALRKEPAARSMEITFENNNSSDRVVEYVKTGAEGSRLRVVLNASGKETDVETEGSVLFARGYENGVLRAGGALVERL